MWTGFVWLRIITVAGSCEHDNEPWDCIKIGKFLYYLSDYQNGSGAHPASYPRGTRGSFPGGKAAGA
jgi:hypothetical protein